jgi:hypothetical protein
MSEMQALSDDEYINLVPDEFLEDEEAYVRRYGHSVYQRLVNVVIFELSCTIPLSDGTHWQFHDTMYVWEPLDPRASNN